MGMTIEQIIKYLPAPICGDTDIGEEKQKEYDAHNSVIIILRKYQKIQEIVKKWELDSWTDNLSYESMIQIREVLEDDNSTVDNSDMRSNQSNTEHCTDSGAGKEQQKPRECIQ